MRKIPEKIDCHCINLHKLTSFGEEMIRECAALPGQLMDTIAADYTGPVWLIAEQTTLTIRCFDVFTNKLISQFDGVFFTLVYSLVGGVNGCKLTSKDAARLSNSIVLCNDIMW